MKLSLNVAAVPVNAAVYIMQEISDQDDQTVYEFVEDEAQLEALSKVFAELLDDVDIQM